MAKILVVDDEPAILELLSYNLKSNGYSVAAVQEGSEVLEAVAAEQPDLVILDLMLPGLDGFEVCRRIREKWSIPIIMLTARQEELDKVLGLELGADDYLTKPFSPRELLARVKAVMRRTNRGEESAGLLRVGGLELDQDKHQLTVDGRPVELTLKEYQLLEILIKNPGRVFDRENLLNLLWGEGYFGDNRTIDVHIRHLREKIEADPSQPQYVLTVRGIGYKFKG